MSNEPGPAPMSDDQQRLLLEAITMVINSPDGCGSVEVTISQGHVRFIRPTVSLDMGRVERSKGWLWDVMESKT